MMADLETYIAKLLNFHFKSDAQKIQYRLLPDHSIAITAEEITLATLRTGLRLGGHWSNLDESKSEVTVALNSLAVLVHGTTYRVTKLSTPQLHPELRIVLKPGFEVAASTES